MLPFEGLSAASSSCKEKSCSGEEIRNCAPTGKMVRGQLCYRHDFHESTPCHRLLYPSPHVDCRLQTKTGRTTQGAPPRTDLRGTHLSARGEADADGGGG